MSCRGVCRVGEWFTKKIEGGGEIKNVLFFSPSYRGTQCNVVIVRTLRAAWRCNYDGIDDVTTSLTKGAPSLREQRGDSKKKPSLDTLF